MGRFMEILAPAGSMEHITAAVRSGANAVYLGTKNFNARRNAENFDKTALRNAITYCHARNVKVYIALNTLITDYELEAASEEIKNAAALGADAVIIQDLAMLRLVKSIVPDMPVHASTQMSVHNISGAKMLEELGFSRVVPARELSLAELLKIRESTSLELEVFVHGALCMCVSGQCYMSSIFGQRSANRGMCAQPCRLNFRNSDSDHILSLKDLSAISMLKELEQLGITSAKIEGRMKRPEYVAAATHACVLSLKGIEYDKKQLRSVFSRSGFTNGYLEGKIDRSMFGYRTKDDVISAAPVLKKIAAEYRNEVPLVGVDMHIEIKPDTQTVLTVTDGKNTVRSTGTIPQAAITRETDKASAESSLKKCGGTPFYIKSIDADIAGGLSVPLSELNGLRKSALDKLLEKREQIFPYRINETDILKKHRNYPVPESCRLFARFENEKQICENVDGMIIDYEILLNNPELCTKYHEKLIAEMPALLFTEKDIDSKLSILKSRGIKMLYAPNIYAIEYGKRHGFKILGGYGLNIMNSLALSEYNHCGLDMAEISFECSLTRFNGLNKSIPCGLAVYGQIPLMSFRICPARNEKGCGKCNGMPEISDRFGNKMTILCKNKTYSRLLNPQPIYMADKLDQIQNASFVILHFTVESKAQCLDVIDKYRNGDKADVPFTRGLYYKEVK